MAVTALMVKELRERTGAGMMDCKNVLEETDGDIERGIELLREKGLAKAAKKAGRVASEGLVRISFSTDGKKTAMAEVNSETDFVAKNADFIGFVEHVAVMAQDAEDENVENFMKLQFKNEGTVQEVLSHKISTIGENLHVRRLYKANTPGCV